jgi:DNA-binding MarR family transcriptional regulator
MTPDERIIEAVERLMVEAIGVTTVALAQAAPEVDLSIAQWRALMVVGSRADGIRVGEIAARIGSAVPTTSRLIRRLERRGLVVAQRDELDRRATLVRLTESGKLIRTTIVGRRRQLVRDALSVRPEAVPGELVGGLAEIAAALHRYE